MIVASWNISQQLPQRSLSLWFFSGFLRHKKCIHMNIKIAFYVEADDVAPKQPLMISMQVYVYLCCAPKTRICGIILSS